MACDGRVASQIRAFAAAKTATWHDRRAPRDLWDLWALAETGAIDTEAAALFRRYGPTNTVPGAHLFEQPPNEADWRSQLAGQTRLTSTASGALVVVRQAWARAANSYSLLGDEEV
ncbi:nucleotidyl transferase AbiEii/AbiGii toxin family protein [Rhodococcus sp. 14C212]|uniref:nucleotidyl transferase AbiEii/AbiGii toxin family protein n=1 Tax=Rhodococcus sp. 14C212 TaxID=2711209 RepID=UPI0013ED8AE2|nr:nucleotidyl transferase AbiEii/AbiGii toxin family protein [Rhodococcus sp. 14C212]NGP08478.1 nucleotidyl transferase AbiEii/AbiGii toxin family protein [Rhodococcus sp. 14C212]